MNLEELKNAILQAQQQLVSDSRALDDALRGGTVSDFIHQEYEKLVPQDGQSGRVDGGQDSGEEVVRTETGG